MIAHEIVILEPLRPVILSEIWFCRSTRGQGRRADKAELRCSWPSMTPECASPGRREEPTQIQVCGYRWPRLRLPTANNRARKAQSGHRVARLRKCGGFIGRQDFLRPGPRVRVITRVFSLPDSLSQNVSARQHSSARAEDCTSHSQAKVIWIIAPNRRRPRLLRTPPSPSLNQCPAIAPANKRFVAAEFLISLAIPMMISSKFKMLDLRLTNERTKTS